MLADVPKQKLITPSIISEKLKVNGSLARKAVRELVSKNLIRTRCTIATNGARTVHKPFLQTHPLCPSRLSGEIMTHKHQSIYTRASNQ